LVPNETRAEGFVPVRKKNLILAAAVLAAFVGPSIGTIGGTDAGASNTQENWQSLGWKSETKTEADLLAVSHATVVDIITADAVVSN
jgi:hypothetical protein